MGRLALALGGMIIGGLVGGPFGARIGFALGSFVGGRLFGDEQVTEGPRIEDRSFSTATYGAPIPIVYGVVRVTGSYVWFQGNELIEIEREEEVGGKGGGGSYRYYEYYITCSVTFCEAPENGIGGITRIWADTKLFYKNTALIEQTELQDVYDGEVQEIKDLNLTIWRGESTQLPDPLEEAEKGVGSAPAYRGQGRMTLELFPLKDFGNRPPNFTAEIVNNIQPYRILRCEEPEEAGTANASSWDISADGKYLFWNNGGGRIYKYDLESRAIVSKSTLVDSETLDNPGNDIYDIGSPEYGTQEVTAGSPIVYSDDLNVVVSGTGFAFVNIVIDGDSLLPLYGFSKSVAYTYFRLSNNGKGQWLFHAAPGNQGIDTYITRLGAQGNFGFLSTAGGTNFEGLSGGAGTFDLAFPEDFTESKGSPPGGQNLFYLWSGISGDAVRIVPVDFAPDLDGPQFNPNPDDGSKILLSSVDNTISGVERAFRRKGRTFTQGFSGFQEWSDTNINGEVLQSLEIQKGSTVQGYRTQADKGIIDDRYFWIHEGSGTNRFAKVDFLCMEVAEYRDFSLWDDGGRIGGETPSLSAGLVYLPAYDGFLTFSDEDGANLRPVIWTGSTGVPERITLRSIVEDLSSRSVLDSTQYDASDLDQELWGFTISRPTQIRRAIEELMVPYQFNAFERDGQIVFWKQGREAIDLINEDDVGFGQVDEVVPRVQENRLQEQELPKRFQFTFLNIGQDHLESTQSAQRADEATNSKDVVDYNMPLVATNTEGRQFAERLLFSAWVERRTLKFSLPRKYNYLHPEEHISIKIDDLTYNNVRLTRMTEKVDNSTIIDFEGVVTEPDTYEENTLDTEGVGGIDPPISQVNRIVESELFLMDTHLLRDEDELLAGGFYYGAAPVESGTIFNGAQIYKSSDNAQFNAWNAVTNRTPWGYVITQIADSPSGGSIVDAEATFDVTMVSGADTLASTTRLGLLNGANPALIEIISPNPNSPTQYEGEWEVIKFLTVEQIGDVRYRFTGLLRGYRGTEHLMALHNIGARIVFPSVTATKRTANTQDKGLTRFYKAVTIGNVFSPEESTEFVQAGRGQRPYSPSHPSVSRDGSNNWTVTFTRRTRLAGQVDWLDGVTDVPLGEAAETYEMDILAADGTTVLRTLESTSESFTYTAAQQIEDFGGVPSSASANLYQTNTTFGRSVPEPVELI